jgi:hypothetical protein
MYLQLDRVDHMLAQSVSVPGQEPPTLSWKSNGIDQFISEAMVEVKHVEATLRAMKGNLSMMEEILDSWASSGLFARYNKSSSLSDFEILQKQIRAQRFSLVKSGGETIHKLLSDSCSRLGLSSGLPDWRSYVDFWNNMVVGGLVQVVIVSLEYLEQQVDPVNIQRAGLPPMLSISIDVIGNKVSFVPELRKIPNVTDYSKFGIRNVVNSWLEGFISVGSTFMRLDSGDGAYTKEIQDDPYVQMLLASINSLLGKMEAKGEEYRRQFQEYQYLWTTDLNEMFKEFLEQATNEHYKENANWETITQAVKEQNNNNNNKQPSNIKNSLSKNPEGDNEDEDEDMDDEMKGVEEQEEEAEDGELDFGEFRKRFEKKYTRAAYLNLRMFDEKLKEFTEVNRDEMRKGCVCDG